MVKKQQMESTRVGERVDIIQEKDTDELSQSNGEMYFEIDDIVVPVKIKDKKSGKVTEYEMREATGDAGCRWRNAISSRMTLGADGKPESMGSIADTEPMLISMCMTVKGTDQHPKLNTIRGWPNRIQKSLFKKIIEISDLEENDAALESAKNEQADTPDG